MRKNKIKQMMMDGKPVINGWLQIPSTVSAEVMAHEGWDSLTVDMQHGLIDYTNALPMMQTISTTDVTPLVRVNWNEPGQIMKILDAGCYGVICPMVSNKKEAENFVQACMYPPHGYRSFGPVRGFLYGGSDYPKHANDEILKFAMIETKESLEKLDEIMKKHMKDLPSQVQLKLPKLKKVNKKEPPKIKLPKLKKVTADGAFLSKYFLLVTFVKNIHFM